MAIDGAHPRMADVDDVDMSHEEATAAVEVPVPDERGAPLVGVAVDEEASNAIMPAAETEQPALSEEVIAVAHFLARQKLTRPEILRTVPARAVLWRFGHVLRTGPYSEDVYNLSQVSKTISQFWSHSWHGSTWNKIILLLAVCNGLPAVVIGSAIVLLTRVLMQYCVLPCIADKSLTTVLPLAFGGAAAGVTLLCWRSRKRVFLDKFCIHQIDPTLKMEGVLNVAALLNYSDSMLVCWDTTYAHRLWCVLEMAAFLKSHDGTGRLMIRPASWGVAGVVTFAGLLMLMAILDIVRFNMQAPFVLWVSMAPLFVLCLSIAAAVMRAHHRAAETVQAQLRSFSFQTDPICHCCTMKHINPRTGQRMECDRQIIGECIRVWFGSVAEFDAFVQQGVAAAFNQNLGMYGFPYRWILAGTVPVYWWGLLSYVGSTYTPGDGFVTASNAFFITGYVCMMTLWWLAYIPMIAMLWMKAVHKLRRPRSCLWQEVLLNVACALSLALLYIVVSMLEGQVIMRIWMLALGAVIRDQVLIPYSASMFILALILFLCSSWSCCCLGKQAEASEPRASETSR